MRYLFPLLLAAPAVAADHAVRFTAPAYFLPPVKSLIVTSTANVSNPSVSALGGQTVAASETINTGPVLLATFTDPGGLEALGDYSANIQWGDGTGTQIGAGAITLNGTTFEVRGSHTYADETGTPFTESRTGERVSNCWI